ncbi:hypothetical protein BHK98_03940 [Hornefia porci]|uniref:DUF1492 domain-containing protein n=1 Tax=Hornefia porci TaxID=2652292 RepID=A0A1Q9JGD3_9FIRM|nr:hypothetical protein [Hornefia porci]OLR55290.1 hypothetical protein BHK98_03940 [Hornefia porci]
MGRAKEFLGGYLNITEHIEQMTEELEALQRETGSISMALDGMPHGTKLSDRTGQLAVRIAEMTLEIMDERTKAWEKREEIRNVILLVDDHNLCHVLRRRYIDGKMWEEIAVEMNYTYRWVISMHGRALEEVEEILKRVPTNSH